MACHLPLLIEGNLVIIYGDGEERNLPLLVFLVLILTRQREGEREPCQGSGS
jgi:hypothetical protein